MTFDAKAFMTATVDAPLDTEYKTCPEGEFEAMFDQITEETFKPMARKDGSPVLAKNPDSSGNHPQLIAFEPFFVIRDAKVEAELGRSPKVRGQSILDIDNGRIATGPGRNVFLGQCLASAGLPPGTPLEMLSGRGPVMVRVRHRPNEADPMRPFAEVIRVAPIR